MQLLTWIVVDITQWDVRTELTRSLASLIRATCKNLQIDGELVCFDKLKWLRIGKQTQLVHRSLLKLSYTFFRNAKRVS